MEGEGGEAVGVLLADHAAVTEILQGEVTENDQCYLSRELNVKEGDGVDLILRQRVESPSMVICYISNNRYDSVCLTRSAMRVSNSRSD